MDWALTVLITVAVLACPLFSPPVVADSAYKVPTANPTIVRGAIVSGSYTNVQTSDNTRMRIREQLVGGIRYIDMQWNTWQAFSEASRAKLIDIRVLLEGYQSNAGDTWHLQFYNYNTGSWDTAWYTMGALNVGAPDSTIEVRVGDAERARSFVSTAGAFRLRLADGNTRYGGGDGARSDIYIDLLRAQFAYDVTPPSSVVTAPSDLEHTNRSTYVVRGDSVDPSPDSSGVAQVSVSVDGGTSWNPAVPGTPGDYSTWSYDWSIPAEGTYTVRSRAADGAANVEVPGAGVRLVVDWTPPRVERTTPGEGEINVNVGANVQARFLEASGIDPATLDATTFTIVDEEGAPVAGSVSFDAGTLTATFDPDPDLFYGYTYTATLTTGVKDLAGNPLAAPYTWTFRTADILSLSLSETYNRDGTPGGGSVDFGTMSPEGSPFVVGGGTPPYAVRFRVLSSTRWNIMVRAHSDLVDSTQTPPAVIPVSRLQWSLAGAGAWRPFDLAGAEMFSPARDRTPQPGGGNVDLDLMLTLDWEDAPGDYAAQVVFVLMEQP
ncbi:MAG: hypothetical protein HPY75_08495 [Actinobacteria bacterium]|nr:hypothetical protein [Actinomycetota bacterium]